MVRRIATAAVWATVVLLACNGQDPRDRRDPETTLDSDVEDLPIVDEGSPPDLDADDRREPSDLPQEPADEGKNPSGDTPFETREEGDSSAGGGCGNGLLEAPGEACERWQTRPCTDFGWNYTGGNAWCRDDCSGWSFTTCLTDGTAACGNGRKESVTGWLEFCDTGAAPCPPLSADPSCFDGVKDCRDLGPGWSGGRSTCSADCRTADVTGCVTTIPAWGHLEGSFETPWVLDESMLDVGGYLSAHREALVAGPAFRGNYAGGRAIPAPDPAVTVTYALRTVRRTSTGWYDQIYVIQETALRGAEGPAFQGAQLELRFRDGPLQSGVEYPVNAGVMGANRLYLFHYTNPDGSGTPDGSHRCLMAVGVGGRVRITRVEGLYQEDGTPSPYGSGHLAFEAEDIQVFWLGETPYGQALSEDFERPGGVQGVEMCHRPP